MIGDKGDQMYCKVKEIDHGGVPAISSLTAKTPISPGKIVLVPAELTIFCSPNKNVPFLTVCVDPKAEEKAAPEGTAQSN